MATIAGSRNHLISTWRVLEYSLKRETPNTSAIAVETLIYFVAVEDRSEGPCRTHALLINLL
jgi:hypothetical protein